MNAFTLAGWDNFFVASAGAAAALAGLLFVALSINLAKILAIPGLTSRAGETFVPLTIILVISLQALVPGIGIRFFACELLFLGTIAWLFATWLEARAYRAHHYVKFGHLALRVVINQPSTLFIAISGLALILGISGGLYWLIPAILLSFVGAMLNAWILLVEILR
jgi:modulator of FtsH protease